jgi:hypothetical protein
MREEEDSAVLIDVLDFKEILRLETRLVGSAGVYVASPARPP